MKKDKSKKKDKNNTLLIIGVLLLVVIAGIGYATLQTNLNITGTANIGTSSWNVHFEDVEETTGSVTATTEPIASGTNTIELQYAVTLSEPGDFYEFEVDVVNSGSLTAALDSATKSNTGYNYILYTVKMKGTGNTLVDVPTDLELDPNDSITLVVRVEYSRELASASTVGTSIGPLSLTYQMNFVQA